LSSCSPQVQAGPQHILTKHRGFLGDIPVGADDPTLPVGTARVRIGWGVRLNDKHCVFNGTRLDLRTIRIELGFFAEAGFV
jgi:hypothetical protein